jgi:hypothetical protein
MAFNYTQYQIELGTLMALTSANPGAPPTDPYFVQILPAIIDYAEQRIYRDLDIQSTRTSAIIQVSAVGNPVVQLPTSPAVYVVESMSIQALGNGSPPPITASTLMTPVDKNFIQATFPPAYWNVAQGAPQFYYIEDQGTMLIGPAPDQLYSFFTIYTFRPTPLSATNTTTILTQIWPDLFLAASALYAAAFQKNFGSQSDDPKMAQSWENQYQTLLKGALDEEARKQNKSVVYGPMRASQFSGKAPTQQ